jgi:cytosine/adenosine deaminase-related metal-dependent hydrolase
MVTEILAEPDARDSHADHIDAAGALVFPGLVNAHTHAYSSLVRGIDAMLPDGDFLELLQSLWWRLDACLEREDLQLSARLAGLEGLRLGVTTVFDHHASYGCIEGSLEEIAAGFEAVGSRCVGCYEVSDRAGVAAARAALEENRRHAAVGPRLPSRLGAMLGLHASFTLSDDTLQEAAALAAEQHLVSHVHVAEAAVDRVPGAQQGTGVVARLQRFGLLRPGSLVAHAVHLQPEELRALSKAGAVVVHNPRSNMNNGIGRADVAVMQRAGLQVTLGTDAYGAGIHAEARAATLLQRQAPRLGDGAGVCEALWQGNVALAGGVLPHLGRLLPGAPADVVVTHYVPPTPLTSANGWSHFLFGDLEARVRTVFVAGERVVDEGRSTCVDEGELMDHCRERAAALWERFRRARPQWQRVPLQEAP